MKTISFAIAASAALSLAACGGGASSTSSSNNSLPSDPQEVGGAAPGAPGLNSGAGVNAGAGGNSSIGAPGNQLGNGNTVVGSAPSAATDGDSVSDNPGQPGNLQ